MVNKRKELRHSTLPALAEETNRSIQVVAALYDDELANLEATSRVKKFIEIIARRRVRMRLLHSKGQ
jgi:hypothetical protein